MRTDSPPYTFQTNETPPVHINNVNISNDPHGLHDFGVGDTFRAPYIAPDSRQWNATSDMYKVYQANINAVTPDSNQLNLIGGSPTLPGPNFLMDDSYAAANVNAGRSNNLNLCSQNFNNMAAGSGVSTSLLPSPHSQNVNEGFSDCNVNTTNVLANQVFLSPGGQMGFDSSNSNRNSNLDLRSAPPNPVLNVGPWLNSTIYPDLLRRPLESSAPSFGVYGSGQNSSATPVSIQQ